MCIDNRRQIDLPSINLFFDDRNYSTKTRLDMRLVRLHKMEHTPADSLDQ